MADFMQQISNFTSRGIFYYKFDSVGNVILNPSSSLFQEHYLSLPLANYSYNENKIESFYEVDIVEFAPPATTASLSSSISDQAQQQIDDIKKENDLLKTQLSDVISQSEQNSSVADAQAIKDIILQLRIDLGEGKDESDFDSEFPYLPKDITKSEL